MPEIAVGGVFAGHRIEAVAGRGGMGVVYRATQLDLDRTVALKVIAPALLADDGVRRRFVRESRVAASLEHPNVIPIHYAGESDGIAYIVMRYVEGDDLRRLTRREGPLPPVRAAELVAQVAAALDAAHAAGLVHRDVKPANVLVAPGDHAYLTDFGLTKRALSAGAETGTGRLVGTIDYVAPEQIRGERVDARADVYALGCLLFFLLTGRVPFPRDGQEAKLWAHLHLPPPAVSAEAPGVPPALDGVISRALAKEPEGRYPSAGDLGRAAFAAATGEEPTQFDERTVAAGEAALTLVAPPSAPPPAPPSRARRWLPAAAVAATLLAGGLALIAARGDEGEPRETARGTSTPGALPEPIPVLPRPNAVAGTGGRVWVGGFLTEQLMAVDPKADRVIRRIDPEVGIGTADMAVGSGALWVALSRDRRVVRVDPEAGRTELSIPVDGTPVAVAADDRDVWVAVRDPGPGPDGKLLRIDPLAGRAEATHPLTAGIVDVAVGGDVLWVLSRNPSRLTRYEPGQRKDETVRLGGREAFAIAVGGGAVWATVPDQDSVVHVDPRTMNPATIAVGDGPAGIGVLGGSVWVANQRDSTLSRIDVATKRAAEDRIPVPTNPVAVAAFEDRLWVTCVGTSQLQPVPEDFRGPGA
jgi:streptogramin lyase